MPQTIQPSFGKGEIAPSLYGRVDTEMYGVALKTARNVLIHTHGGASNRGGLRFLAPTLSNGQPSRLIPFLFNTTDKYILEFGETQMRVMRDGAHVTQDPIIIQGATNANPIVITSTSHGLTDGEEVYITDVDGMIELNGNRYILTNTATDTFELISIFTGEAIDSTSYHSYVGGGSAAVIYTIESPYTHQDLAKLKYVQSADVMTFTHSDYPIYELSRTGHDQWAFTLADFAPRTAYPTNVAVTAGDVGNYRARYKVTAIGSDESLPGLAVDRTATIATPGITNASPGEVTTLLPHGFATGNIVLITGVVGMTEVNDTYFTITSSGANTFTLGVDTTTFGVWTSDGICELQIEGLTSANPVVITQTAHGFATDDEIEINDVVTPTDLNGRRFLLDVLTANTFALRDEDGEFYDPWTEGGTAVPTFAEVRLDNISNITAANPGVVTVAAGHGIQEGVLVKIAGVSGMVEVNDRNFTTGTVTATTIQLKNVNTSGYTAYTSGGSIWQKNTARNTISWGAVAGADGYRIYKEDNGKYGFVGGTDALSFVEDNILPDALDGPPRLRNPFFGLGNQPQAVGFYEQRRVFGGTFNEPDTSFYSVTGAPSNFTVHDPIQDDDAITITLTSQQVNEIRHFVPLQDLLILTSGGEWRATSGPDSAFTPTGVKQKPQTYFGCSHLRPLISGNTVLFAEESNANVRTLNYSFQIDGFTGTDVGLLAPHLLYTDTAVDWSFQGNPDNRVYIVRDDGKALTITYDEEQNVTAWTHLDTDGFFESVATLRRGEDEHHDNVYFVVKRTIDGTERRYIEQLDQSSFEVVEDCFFVDSGLTYDDPREIGNVTVDVFGTVTVTTATSHGVVNGDEVDLSEIEWVPEIDAQFNSVQPDQLNGGRFTVANCSSTTCDLAGVDGTDWNSYVRNGKLRKAITTVVGLDHLNGEEVIALMDGNTVSGLSVVNGTCVLPRPSTRIHFGLRYIADLETLDIEAAGPSGTLQGHLKKVNFVVVKFERTRGLLIGPDFDHLIEMKQRSAERYDEPTRLLTGNSAPIFIQSAWNSNGRIALRQRYPLPFTVLAIIPNFEVGTRDDNS